MITKLTNTHIHKRNETTTTKYEERSQEKINLMEPRSSSDIRPNYECRNYERQFFRFTMDARTTPLILAGVKKTKKDTILTTPL